MRRMQCCGRGFSTKRKKRHPGSLLPAACLSFVLLLLTGSAAAAGAIYARVPSTIDPQARYLFYLHGQAIEQGGRHAEAYKYYGILQALADRGFVVIGEERDPVDNHRYAKKVARQVKKLLAAGVPATNITVAGHSKGGMITLIVMTMLDEREIAYVNFAGCGREGGSHAKGLGRFAAEEASRARGRLLSSYDKKDTVAGSCAPVMEKMTGATTVQERVLDVGGGHTLFYRPDKDWLDVLQAWAQRQER